MTALGNTKEKHDPFSSLRISEFKFFLINKFFLSFGIQMQSVIVGWQVYEITGNVLSLGLIGLAEAIPFIAVSFFSGHVADTFNRKRIILLFTFLLISATFVLYYLSLDENRILLKHNITPVYIIIGLIGVIRGFLSAAFPSMMSQIVPRTHYANASTWSSTVWHIASVLGPSSAGLLIFKNKFHSSR